MSFIMLLVAGVSIPANAFGSPFGDAAVGATRSSSSSESKIQALSAPAASDDSGSGRDGVSVTMPVVEKLQAAGGAGEPIAAGICRVGAAGPVLWPTDVSPQIGRGVTASHHGQDLLMPQGTPVHAIADGTVLASTIQGSYGQYVVVQSIVAGHTVTSLYAHMGIGSETVVAGQTVTMGQTIGLVGSSGSATGYLLYLRIVQDGALCDSITFIAGNPAGGAAPHG